MSLAACRADGTAMRVSGRIHRHRPARAPFWAWMAKYTEMDVEDGAMPQIRAATDPRAKGGEFCGPCFVGNGRAVRLPALRRGNQADIASLWQVSARETGVELAV